MADRVHQPAAMAAARETATSNASVAQLELVPLAAGEVPAGGRGVGRPAGARNRETRELIALVTRKYGVDPIEQGYALLARVRSGETLAEDLAAFARELGCTKLEAFDRLTKIRDQVLPYAHQQAPKQVEVGPIKGAGIDDLPEIDGNYEIVVNQGLSEAGDDQV